MGMFTSVMHPTTGDEIQFKCGYDDCEWYALGHEVDWFYDPNQPMAGKLLDGAYDGESSYWDYDQHKHVYTGRWWVVIKDHKVVAVEPILLLGDALARLQAEQPLPADSPQLAERLAHFNDMANRWGRFDGGYTAQRAYIEAKHGVELPPLDAWSQEVWANQARRMEEGRRLVRQWQIEDFGFPPEERARRSVNRFTRMMMQQDSFFNKVLAPAEQS